MKSFLLIDDHSVIQTALKLILENMLGPIHVAEAHDAASALDQLKAQNFTLIIMDVSMPNTDSLALMQNMLALQPDARVLVFSMNDEGVFAKRYLKLGAKGYLKKDATEAEIQKAIFAVLNNKRYISSFLAEMLASESIFDKTENPFDLLSVREFEILQHLLRGASVSHISKSLHLSASTVSTHKNKIFQKLGVKNTIEVNKLAQVYNVGL